MDTRRAVSAGLAGVLFAVGLILGGMTRPSKVIGFLDVTGDWDPSLAFVMGGAVLVFMPLYRLITRRSGPLLAPTFALPTRRDVDGRLLLGAALFGMGWGLAGYCPGPALTVAGSLSRPALIFTAAMVVGFAGRRGLDFLGERQKPEPTTSRSETSSTEARAQRQTA